VDCLVTGDSSDTLSVLHHGVSNTFPYRAVAAWRGPGRNERLPRKDHATLVASIAATGRLW